MTNSPRWALIAAAVLLAGGGCQSEPPRHAGTARMVDTLAKLYARALANSQRYPYLNRRRAEVIESLLAGQTGTEARRTGYYLALERLRAGQNREAIAALEQHMQEWGFTPDSINQDKPLYDLEAMAYLRLAEQENCIDHPGADVCILPLSGKGRHSREEGARGAITRYETILKRFPDDYGSRWLLNIAYMAIGGYPGQVPKPHLIPGLAPDPSARFPRFQNIGSELGVGVSGVSGGLVAEDLNGDGLVDLFITRLGPNDQARLFLADGQGGYVEHTEEAGLIGITGGLNSTHADYDNDGDTDILILRGAWLGDAGEFPNSLLRNRGDATFEDVTFESGLLSFHPTQAAAWADYNLDGCLDLFIGNESLVKLPWVGTGGTSDYGSGVKSHPSELFRNNCDGTFTEVSRQVGIELDDFVKGVAWGDVNNDGLPDLFASVIAGSNRLYLNRGATASGQWRFEERAAAAGVTLPTFSFPTWFWDFDQDGWEDLLVQSFDLRLVNGAHDAVAREYLGLPVRITREGKSVEIEYSRLYRNNRDGTFTDLAREAGLEKVLFGMGTNFGDLDNDGWLDFYVGTGTPDLRSIVPNRMFRNVPGRGARRRFEEVTLPGGFGHIQKGHATAFVDLDRDGDEDVYMVMGGAYEGDRFANALFENPGWPHRNWITLRLEGRSANRGALGARVELVVEEPNGETRTLWRTIGTGGSFGAGSLELHVGLDQATMVERLTVRWPDAQRSTTTYEGLAINRYYRIVQGEQPVILDRPPVPFRKGIRR
ncbi:MAG: CRTAC1 family protein [Gemmatimonadales bacterium]